MKHKRRNKAISWLLSLAMLLSLMPAFSLTAWAGDVTSYGVWVGGEEVTSANLSGEGWSYTPATDMGDFIIPANLTLNGYSYEGAGHAGNTFSGAIYAEQDLQISLGGESSNSVISAGNDAATSCAIYAGGDLYIYGYGSGSLTASGPMGIVAGGKLTINCGTHMIPSGSITVTGSSGSGIHSVNGNIEIQDGNLTVNGGTYGVSTGNHTGNGVGDLTIIGGTLTVNSDGDYGICVKKMVLNEANLTRSTVTATGTKQAISAETVTVGECMYVKAGTDKDNSSPVENTSTWTHTEKWVKAKVFPKLYVGDTEVTRSVRSGEGWSFDPDTDTLTLNGYSYSGAGYKSEIYSYALFAGQELNIVLLGDNTVINTLNSDDFDEYGIHVAGKLSISGKGTLTAQGVNGIFATREIAIESGKVDVTSTGTSFADVCIHSYAVTINGGTVKATGASQYGAINADNSITINGGTVNATATGQESYALCAGAVVTINGGSVTASGTSKAIDAETVTIGEGVKVFAGDSETTTEVNAATFATNHDQKWAKIEKPFPVLYVGGTQVTHGNTSDVFGDGKVSFDPDTNTLTLSGYSYSGAGYTFVGDYDQKACASIYAAQDLTIQFSGTNSVSNTYTNGDVQYGHGIYVADGDLTITGVDSDTLTVSAAGTSGNGIYSNGGNITITGGTVTATSNNKSGIESSGGNITITGGTVTATGEGQMLSFGINCMSSQSGQTGGSVTITGGTVTATGSYGISSLDTITVTGGTVIATGKGMGISSQKITFNGGTVTATGEGDNSTGISGDINFNGGTVTATGEGDNSDGISGNINFDGGTVTATGTSKGVNAQNVSLGAGMTAKVGDSETDAQPGTDWGMKWIQVEEGFPVLYVGGVKVTESNAANVFSDGKVSFDPETNTLTLNGYTFDGAGYKFAQAEYFEDTLKAAIYYGGAPKTLNILLKGENAITCTNEGGESYFGNEAYAIKSKKDVAIRAEDGGKLTLNAKGGRAFGVQVVNLTVESGDVSCTSEGSKAGVCLHMVDGGTLTVNGGKLTLNDKSNDSSSYGIEARHVVLNGGAVSVEAKWEGIACRGLREGNIGSEDFKLKESGSLTVNGGSIEIGVSGNYGDPAAVYMVYANMTLGDNVTMLYGQSKDNAVVYTGDNDKAYEVLCYKEENYQPIQSAAKYVSFVPTHTHGEGENAVTFQPWSSSNSLPSDEGSYYLTNNVTLTETWKVPEGTTNLCLDGHSITYGGYSSPSVNILGSGCTLNLYDKADNSGTITGGKDSGVVVNGGVFNMYGGTISGNRALYGGGVNVSRDQSTGGIFNMSGGSITNNEAYAEGDPLDSWGGSGGGVFVSGICSFSMSGTASITGNKAAASGGGVYVNGGASYYQENPGVLTISGDAVINGNTDTAETPVASNVFLGMDDGADGGMYNPSLDAKITIAGELTGSNPIGVTVGMPGAFTSGWGTHMSGKKASDFFASEDSGYVLGEGDTELELTKVPVSYMDWDAAKEKLVLMSGENGQKNYTEVTANDMMWGQEGKTTWYVVNGNVENNKGIYLYGDVRLILCDNASLTININDQAGIRSTDDNSNLTVYAQSTGDTMGRMTVNGGSKVISIGESGNAAGVTINGGDVTVDGSENATGIYARGNVTINSGKVNVGASGLLSNGIHSYNGNVTINGGNVTAKGGFAIFAQSGSVTVNDGAVEALSKGGDYDGSIRAVGVTVNGGTVTADGGTGTLAHGILLDEESVLEVKGGDVTVIGGDKAIYGTVKNATVGTGWTDTAGTGSGAAIAVNATQGQSLDFKRVVFIAPQYTVSFDANGGAGTMSEAQTGAKYELPANAFTAPVGKLFAGWKIGDSTYKAKEEIKISADTEVKAQWGQIGDPGIDYETRQRPLSEAFSGLPDELKAKYSTLDSLQEALFAALFKSGRAPRAAQVQYLDVDLYVKPDGVNWEKATLDNFPAGKKVTGRISYPAGTSKENNAFFVSHIFQYTSERLGTTVGESEAFMASCTADGVEFEVSGLSPIAVAWVSNGSFAVVFETNGGSAIASKTVGDGTLLKETEAATSRKGYIFDGWYKNEQFEGDKWDFSKDGVTGNTTLYAKWTENPATAATVTANSRTYDGTEKPLVTVDNSTLVGGEMQYALGTATEATQPYTTSIPVATDAGSYYVWYKVEGDTNHNDTEAACVTVTIRNRPSSGGSSAGTTITVPVSSDSASVSVTASVSGATASVKALTETELNKVVNSDTHTGEVEIDVSGLGRTVTVANIPTETVKMVEKAVSDTTNDATGLTVKLTGGSITLDAQALGAVAEQAKGSTIQLNLDGIAETKMTSAQRETVQTMDVQAVYDAYMTSGGQRISDFHGGRATVMIPYTLKDGQNRNGIVVWYVADDGGKTEMPTAYDGKQVSFTTTHFSNYVVAYDVERAAVCPQDATCPISKFTDADAKAWYHDGVHWALENGVMQGVSPKYFSPNGDTTRAMVVTMLWRMEGSPAYVGMSEFTDVDNEQWYGQAVRWANAEGIVEGYSNTKFGPNDAVTREQLAAILYRYAQYKKADVSVSADLGSFNDAATVSGWATSAMQWAVGSGIINGMDGNLVPAGNATRAQVAMMLMRYSTAK